MLDYKQSIIMKKFTLMLTALFVSGFCFSQSILTGTVVYSELKKGLPGASIVVKGTATGVTADFDGDFSSFICGL